MGETPPQEKLTGSPVAILPLGLGWSWLSRRPGGVGEHPDGLCAVSVMCDVPKRTSREAVSPHSLDLYPPSQ